MFRIPVLPNEKRPVVPVGLDVNPVKLETP
jgi:hypothetical protein